MPLEKLNYILIAWILAFVVSFVLYPFYIKFLRKIKAGKTLRDDATSWWKATIFNKLHANKKWTPTMWWALILLVVAIFVIASIFFKKLWYVNYSLLERSETYILLFAFFSMWILWLIDDFLNIKWIWKVKWLTAKIKLVWMFLFSAFISYWMYFKLGIDYIILWNEEIHIWLLYFIFTFIFTVFVVNAVNITDWLDWLAWWIIVMILFALWVITFFQGWYVATALLSIISASLVAFLWYNINPSKVFMWDSGALALWGIIASVIYLLWIKLWIWVIVIPLFLILFAELISSFLQIFWKKIFKKKLFHIAPLHHEFEYKWYEEHSIVMKFWLVQAVLTILALVIFFYQVNLKNAQWIQKTTWFNWQGNYFVAEKKARNC